MVGFAWARRQNGGARMARITKAEYEALAALRYRLRQFLRFSEEAAHGLGFTPQQHQALLAIKGLPRADRMTIGELAERLQIRHHSAVGLANRLTANGLVKRTINPADRRQVNLTLTPRGEKVLENLSATHRAQLRQIGPEIEKLLKRLRKNQDDA
jgi:DNA-binding MarR family transcriptional regulator